MSNMKVKTEVVLSINEIMEYVNEKFGQDLVVKTFEVKESGDYDRGTYKKELLSITFQAEEKFI